MARVAIGFSLAVFALGAIGVLSPTTLLSIARQLATPGGLILAAAIRVVFGTVLMLAAPASRAPQVLRVVGLIIVLGGVLTPFFGVERARAVLDWWSGQGTIFMRISGGLALAVGSGFLYLLSSRSGAA